MADKRVGTVLDIPLLRDAAGDFYLDVSRMERLWLTHACVSEYSLDNFTAQARAAMAGSPADRVLAAARRFVATEGASTADFESLVTAVEELENAECGDGES